MTQVSDVAADRPTLSIDLGLGGTIAVGAHRISVSEAVAILEAIAETRSVQGIAAVLGLSYRAAWERLRGLETALGHQLVHKTRGHGSTLTPTGTLLRDTLAAAAASLAAPMAREGRAIQSRLGPVMGGVLPPLGIVASHDLLLMDVAADWPGVALTVAGSEEAVARLLDGRADAAGFHCGPVDLAAAGPAFAGIADPETFRVRPVFEREQGLMLAAGNPLRICGIRDLAERNVRYVNRQGGSGTRVWFDRLLAQEGIPSARIRGYTTEEFTHQAVAAVIAYGAADAGLGARAAANRFGLDFLSIGWERYYLACPASLAETALDAFADALAARAGGMPGYRPAQAPN